MNPRRDAPPARPLRSRLALCRTGGLLCLVLLAGACGDNLEQGPGAPDARPINLPPDAAIADAAVLDAPSDLDAGADCPRYEPTACTDETPCADADQACVAGVCVATCGQDVAEFEAALGDDVAVIANLCVAAAVRGVYLGEVDGCEAVTVYDLAGETDGDGDLTFTLSRFALDPAVPAPAVSTVGTTTIDVPDDVSAFPGSYLAVAPGPNGNDAALFGYTLGDADTSGEVVLMDTSDGASDPLTANGNFDVAWLDDSRYLINGQAAGALDEGQGLYQVDRSGDTPAVSHAVTGLGDFSGAVAVDRGRSLVFAGGFSLGGPGSGNLVFVIPFADIEAALDDGTPLDAEGTAEIQRFDIPSSFELLGDRFVTFDFGTEEHQVRPFTIAGDGAVTVDDPTLLAGPPFDGVTVIDADRALLHHPDGALLIELAP